MNLIRSKAWLNRHKKWRADQTALLGITRLTQLNALNEKYLRLVQANAMQWCAGKTEREIEERVWRLLK